MERLNRLAAEKSPYLLQHASNPVDWYAWGEEALERARREDRPIFLSIGYSTCHWCHVMERESFEDAEVARLLNETFVCVKVDREERPDIDGAYMAAAQAMTGRGGWPLTVLLTPGLQPFYAGTYLPRVSRPGLIGMLDLVPRVAQLWRDRRADVARSASEITRVVAAAVTPPGPEALDAETVLRRAFERLSVAYDSANGGFGAAPKFPAPHNLVFLLRMARREKSAAAMADRTLRAMRLGGIWDHVGFGFHRYSTDARWLVPHFEKMLYDQALITIACCEAFAVTGAEEHARTAREIVAYLLRDMRSPEGGFFSAEDADSQGEEGRFYLWTAGEIRGLLGADAAAAMALMSVAEDGNFRDEAEGRTSGANILHRSPIAPANAVGEDGWERCRAVLFEAREKRPRPARDDKVLADWNGLAIAALARAGSWLGEARFTAAAADAAAFVLESMRGPDGRLLHRYRAGDAAIPAFLDDYAFVLWGLIELHQATLETRWLAEAARIGEIMLADFRDDGGGGLLFTPRSAPPPLVRRLDSFDHATPSGNSVAAHELLRLSRLTGRPGYEAAARAIFEAFSARLLEHPEHHTHMITALELASAPSVEVVVAADRPREAIAGLPPLPGVVFLGRAPGDRSEEIAPFMREMRALDRTPTWYVCRDHACALPTTDRERAFAMIRQVSAVN